MATNLYFNHFPKNITSEQLLVEDLVIESLKMYGMDVFYMPRTTRDQVDYLYGEDPLKQYVSAFPIEMYLENITGMDGEGDFISKFGLEIRDEITLLVSRRRFQATANQIRPNEGDLIYVPVVNGFFEITFVEHEDNQAMYHTLGRGRGGNVYLYALKLKQFVFSNEVIETGVGEIDNDIREYYPRTKISISTMHTGKFVNDEIVYQGDSLATSTAQAIVYDFYPNSHIDIIRVQGTFTSANVIGETSNSIATISTANGDAYISSSFEDIQDNVRIESESDSIIDFTETNPFGEP
jgi:hypothetical protein